MANKSNRTASKASAVLFALVFAVSLPLLAHGGDTTGPADGPVNMNSGVLIAPVAGRGHGAGTSFWVTDLWVRGEQGDLVTLEFHSMDAPSAAPLVTVDLPMTSPVIYLPDVLEKQFGLETAIGNIVMRSQQGHGLSGTVRTYDASTEGTYGSAFMAMPASMGMGSWMGDMMEDHGQHELWVQGLLPQPQARVNIAITNSSDEEIRGTLHVIDADGGTPATGAKELPFAIQGYSGHQFNDILAGVHSRFGNDAGLQVKVELEDGTPGMMMVLASVVDNTTNDAYTVMGNMMWSGQGGGGMMP